MFEKQDAKDHMWVVWEKNKKASKKGLTGEVVGEPVREKYEADSTRELTISQIEKETEKRKLTEIE